MSEQPPISKAPKEPVKTSQIGCWIGWVGPVIAVLPLFFGMIGSIGCPQPANEGNCAAAAAPWLMFFTIPLGFIMGLAGLIIFTVSKISENKQK
ncbi:MAG: hypothetical protein RLZZ330_396 [Actinomycetota bacterium]